MEEDLIHLKRNLSEQELSILGSELAKYKKSTAVAYVLWFFLGGLGIHKFYIGKTGMGIFYLLLVSGLIVGSITGMSKEMGPAMIIAGSCGLVLGIQLLVDLFTIPRQIRRTYIQAERQILSKIRSTPKDRSPITADSSRGADFRAHSAEDMTRIAETEKYRAEIKKKAGNKRIGCLPLILIILFVLGVLGYFASRTPSPRKFPSPRAVIQSILDKIRMRVSPKKPPRFVSVRATCNIRSGPGTNYPITRKAAKGEKLEYVSLEGNWYRLKVANGKPQEWVHKSVVESVISEPETPKLPQVMREITVRGKRIKVGDLGDDVLKILKPEDTLKLEITQDPNNPQSLVVTRYCMVEGKVFALELNRSKDPGPYRLGKIILDKLPPGSSAKGKTIKK
jgi:TM2 domain-containing membrane protein YozV/SH3-like domain-containing protein